MPEHSIKLNLTIQHNIMLYEILQSCTNETFDYFPKASPFPKSLSPNCKNTKLHPRQQRLAFSVLSLQDTRREFHSRVVQSQQLHFSGKMTTKFNRFLAPFKESEESTAAKESVRSTHVRNDMKNFPGQNQGQYCW